MGDALRHRIQQVHFESAVQEAFLNVLVAADHLRAQTERLCAGFGISASQYNVLRILRGVHPEGHGVLFNGLLERHGSGMPVQLVSAKDQQDLVRVPLLFDVLKESGQTSAAINWPCG